MSAKPSRAGTQSCGGAARTASTYTITDNDSPVVLAKNWTNGIAGDAVGLSISGEIGQLFKNRMLKGNIFQGR